MKVLLQKNVQNLGEIGDLVNVKPGYARNYLLSHGLATEPTEANIRAIKAAKQQYLLELAKQKEQLKAKAAVVHGKEITISARANEEGHLYGSIGPAQIASALAAEQVFIEPQHVVIDEPIRRLDKYDLTIRFAEDVTATIHLWVVPVHQEQGEGQTAPSETNDLATEASDATEVAPDDQDRQ